MLGPLKVLIRIERLTMSLVGVSGPTSVGLLLSRCTVLCTVVRLIM